MAKLKHYFRYVNQWNVIFYFLIFNGIILGLLRSTEILDIVLSSFTIWALFLLGYNSLDRELEINLTKAKERIATQDYN